MIIMILLKMVMLRPTALEIYVMDADGKNMKQITNLGKASFAPFFHPSGKKIIFSSNYNGDNPRDFNLFMINLMEQDWSKLLSILLLMVFQCFHRMENIIVFGSNRFNKKEGDTNIFIAEWVE